MKYSEIPDKYIIKDKVEIGNKMYLYAVNEKLKNHTYSIKNYPKFMYQKEQNFLSYMIDIEKEKFQYKYVEDFEDYENYYLVIVL